jgi:hypothetical protein
LISTQVANEEKTAEQTNLCFTRQLPLFAHYLQLAMLPMSFSHGEVSIGNPGKHVQNATNWGQVPPGLQPSVYDSWIGRSLNVILDRIRGDSSGFTSEIAFTTE